MIITVPLKRSIDSMRLLLIARDAKFIPVDLAMVKVDIFKFEFSVIKYILCCFLFIPWSGEIKEEPVAEVQLLPVPEPPLLLFNIK